MTRLILVEPMWLMLLIRIGLFYPLLDQIAEVHEEGKKIRYQEDVLKNWKLQEVWLWEIEPTKEALCSKLHRLNLLASTYKWVNTMNFSKITKTISKALRFSPSKGHNKLLLLGGVKISCLSKIRIKIKTKTNKKQTYKIYLASTALKFRKTTLNLKENSNI